MKFSVLLSIYYKESPIYFRESLNSILSQTLRPSEIILVEDGLLTEELDNEINRYLDLHPHLKIIPLSTNQAWEKP